MLCIVTIYLSSLYRLICIIEELRLFTITPTHGTLQPGETCTLTISYKHSSLKYNGIHNLPLLVRIAQGKQFYLDVRGRTLGRQHTPYTIYHIPYTIYHIPYTIYHTPYTI
ncbi:hypothetical protein EON65_49675, partial [archaeon]